MTAKILPLRRLAGATEELSDEALLAACALGDPAALGALFDRHYEGVRGFIYHLTSGGDADVDDLVQITFETVQKASRRFSQKSEVRTWILGIARNVVRRNVRSRMRRRRLAIELIKEPPPVSDSIEETLTKQQRIEALRRAAQSLSPKLREAFVLVYIQGLSGPEAAKVVGVGEGAIWKRLHFARKKICEAMEQDV